MRTDGHEDEALYFNLNERALKLRIFTPSLTHTHTPHTDRHTHTHTNTHSTG